MAIEPEMREREFAPRHDQPLVHGRQLLARQVQLPAELAHVAEPHGERHRVRDANRAHREPRKGRIRQVRGAHPGQQLPRAWAGHDERAVNGP